MYYIKYYEILLNNFINNFTNILYNTHNILIKDFYKCANTSVDHHDGDQVSHLSYRRSFSSRNKKIEHKSACSLKRNNAILLGTQQNDTIQIRLHLGEASSSEVYARCQYRYVFHGFRAGPCCYNPLKKTPGVVKQCLTVKIRRNASIFRAT